MMTGFERYTKKTRRAQFLEEMEQVVPGKKLCALIEPHYPQAGNGRPPVSNGTRRGVRSLPRTIGSARLKIEDINTGDLRMRNHEAGFHAAPLPAGV